MTRNEVINYLAPLVIEVCKSKTKKILPSVCLGQAICESGWMTSQRMVNANALFGIKVGKNKVHFGDAWDGSFYDTKTKECYDGKNYVDITDKFRSYKTVRDSIEDYYDMMGSCSRYKNAINEKNYVKCITAIKNGGYATAPDYISTICNIIESNNLIRFDGCMVENLGNLTVSDYEVGKTYIITASDLIVRKEPSTTAEKVGHSNLSTDGQKHDKDRDGGLDKGTRITCLEINKHDNETWIRTPSGWCCAKINRKVYVK